MSLRGPDLCAYVLPALYLHVCVCVCVYETALVLRQAECVCNNGRLTFKAVYLVPLN